jgi:enoyl-CoA hydratase
VSTRYDDYHELLITQDGAVLTISLNNPPMNAIGGERHRELSTIFRVVNDDPSVHVVVLTAPGEVFSAGGDVKKMAGRLERNELDTWPEVVEIARNLVYGLVDCEKPVIARVNGDCLGLGATLCLMSDLSVMVDDAVIGDPHVRIGLVPGDGAALIWPQHVGFARAKEYLLTGDTLPATRAAEIGLVNYAVPRAQLDAKVDELAQKIARLPAPATSGTKKAINSALRRHFEGLVDANLSFETSTFLSAEHRERLFALRDRQRRKEEQ